MQVLSRKLEENSSRIVQSGEGIRGLEASVTNLDGGIAEVAGRVVTLEQRTTTMEQKVAAAQAQQAQPDPWFQARTGGAFGPKAAEPTTTTAQQGAGQGLGAGGGTQNFFVGSPQIQREKAPYNANWNFLHEAITRPEIPVRPQGHCSVAA